LRQDWWRRRIVVEQDPIRGSIQIVVLPRPQRPQEKAKPTGTDGQADRQQEQEDRQRLAPHRLASRCRRRLLAITSSDELDIAAAASHGVTQPVTASGTMMML
jgi:hypothetical protein